MIAHSGDFSKCAFIRLSLINLYHMSVCGNWALERYNRRGTAKELA